MPDTAAREGDRVVRRAARQRLDRSHRCVSVLAPAARQGQAVRAGAEDDVAPDTAAPRVITSAPRAAGDGLDIADRQRVGAIRQAPALSAPAPRLIVAPDDRAPPRVMISAPVPPVMVSTLLTVSVLAPLARVRLSVPLPRLMVPPEIAAPRVMSSAPVPPVMVSTLVAVTVLAPLARVRLSMPAPRLMLAPEMAAPRVMVSMRRAAGDGLDVGDRQRVGGIGQGEAVGAGAEVDGAGGLTFGAR